MYSYDDELDAEQRQAMQDAMDQTCSTSVMGPTDAPPESGVFPKGPIVEPPPESGVYYKPMNPDVEVPGRPVDDPIPEYEPEPPEMPPDPGPPPSSPPEPLQPPETYPELEPSAPEAPEIDPTPGEGALEGAEGSEAAVEGGELAVEGGELAVEGAELAEGGAALGELAPVAAAGIAGYAVGSAIAPYVYGDKNLDGSPVVKYENVDDIDPNYKDTWAYKINQWLDD
jgi:hypothetical protein